MQFCVIILAIGDFMGKKIYNSYEFNLALRTSDTDPASSIDLFEQYLSEYPKDYSAYPFYCDSLIVMGLLEKAEAILDQVQEESMSDRYFCSHSDKVDFFNRHMTIEQLKVLCYQERYDELLDFYYKNEVLCIKLGLEFIPLLCRKRLNLLRGDEVPFSYVSLQILNYTDTAFFGHIGKHFYEANEHSENPNKYVFEPSFSKDTIVDCFKLMQPSKRLLLGYFEDTYVFKLDECGRIANRSTDYFKIVAFHNTSEFITAFPAADCSLLPYVDLNHLRTDDSPKVKTLSQTEKFYRRYGRK